MIGYAFLPGHAMETRVDHCFSRRGMTQTHGLPVIPERFIILNRVLLWLCHRILLIVIPAAARIQSHQGITGKEWISSHVNISLFANESFEHHQALVT